jgi:hypothetical protein
MTDDSPIHELFPTIILIGVDEAGDWSAPVAWRRAIRAGERKNRPIGPDPTDHAGA